MTAGAYFAELAGFIKIGQSRDIQKRVSDLRRGGVVMPPGVPQGELTLLAICPSIGRNPEWLEKRYHEEFTRYRVAGEWYLKEWSLMAEIAYLRRLWGIP